MVTNRDVFATDPLSTALPNDGVAKVEEPSTAEEWDVLRYELRSFVCEGEYARGLERIIEDILDPNRNVDPAFRYSIITKTDNDIVTGLQRRQEGEKLIFADSQGKEFSIDESQIKKKVESKMSLMPSNFADIIPPNDFSDLLTFLMSRRPGGKNGPTTTVSK